MRAHERDVLPQNKGLALNAQPLFCLWPFLPAPKYLQHNAASYQPAELMLVN